MIGVEGFGKTHEAALPDFNVQWQKQRIKGERDTLIHVPNLRKCRVTVRDIEGVTHKVDVTAESLNEAVGLAIAIIRKEEWASMLPEVSAAQIEVQ